MEALSRQELIELVQSLQSEIAREHSGEAFRDRVLARIRPRPLKPETYRLRDVKIT